MGKISVRILRKRDEKAARDVQGWHEAVRRNRIVEMRVPRMASYTDLTNDVVSAHAGDPLSILAVGYFH